MQFALTRLSLPAQRQRDELAAYTHVPTSSGVRHHSVRRVDDMELDQAPRPGP